MDEKRQMQRRRGRVHTRPYITDDEQHPRQIASTILSDKERIAFRRGPKKGAAAAAAIRKAETRHGGRQTAAGATQLVVRGGSFSDDVTGGTVTTETEQITSTTTVNTHRTVPYLRQ